MINPYEINDDLYRSNRIKRSLRPYNYELELIGLKKSHTLTLHSKDSKKLMLE